MRIDRPSTARSSTARSSTARCAAHLGLLLALIAALAAAPVQHAAAQNPDRALPDRALPDGAHAVPTGADEMRHLPEEKAERLRAILARRSPIGRTRWNELAKATLPSFFTRSGVGVDNGYAQGGDLVPADFNDDGRLDFFATGIRANPDTPLGAEVGTDIYLQQADGTFDPMNAGFEPVYVGDASVADVDGDGDKDVLLSGLKEDFTPETALYLRQSDGSFAKAGAGFADLFYSATAIADVDGSGRKDVLVSGRTNAGEKRTILYVQQQDGTFFDAQAGFQGVTRGDLSVADVDGDADADVLVTGRDPSRNPVTILYTQKNDGTFTTTSTPFPRVERSTTVVADVNADGRQDVVITGETLLGEKTELYWQQSDGSFTRANVGLTGARLASVAVADFDEDGRSDLLISGSTASSEIASYVYLQQSDETFAQQHAGITSAVSGRVASGDFDGDGDVDALATGGERLFGGFATRLYVNRTVQSGLNRAPQVLGVESDVRRAAGTTGIRGVEFGDADGDELSLQLVRGGGEGVSLTELGSGLGLVTFAPDRSQMGSSVTAEIEASDGSGTVASATVTLTVPEVVAARSLDLPDLKTTAQHAIELVDVDGDLDQDALVVGQADGASDDTEFYRQQADGSFAQADAGLPTSFNGDFAVADLNGDTESDVVFTRVIGTVETALYVGEGDGTFTNASVSLPSYFSSSVDAADVNGDGAPDVVLSGGGDSGVKASLHLQQSDGSFTETASFAGAERGSAQVSDVNGDGAPDVLLTGDDAENNPQTLLYRQNDDGTFTSVADNLTDVESKPAIGDADGDGDSDLFVAGRDQDFNTTATLFLQQEDGTFQPANAGFDPVSGGAASFVDANGDGVLDLLVHGAGRVVLYLQQEGGTFAQAEAGFPVDGGGRSAAADVDDDGDPDLLVAGSPTRLYENVIDPASAFAEASVSGAGSQAFGDTGVTVDFADGTSGSGAVRVTKFDRRLLQTNGIPSGPTVSQYRYVIETSGVTPGTGTAVRFDLSTMAGTPDPAGIDVYRRNPPGSGQYGTHPGSSVFTKVDRTYDSSASELVVTADGDAAYGEYVFVSDTNPLPVEMAGVDARTDGESVRLTWRTATETGNAAFHVQRRTGSGTRQNGEEQNATGQWTTVGTVEGAGTTDAPQTYRFEDADLPYAADELTYRLRQVDADGEARLSEAVTVQRPVREAELRDTYPNPARRQMTVRYAVPERQEATLRLYDVLGREVQSVDLGRVQGRKERQLDVSALPSGTYFLRLDAGGVVETRRLTVVR